MNSKSKKKFEFLLKSFNSFQIILFQQTPVSAKISKLFKNFLYVLFPEPGDKVKSENFSYKYKGKEIFVFNKYLWEKNRH